ncbi:hypothetical protein [Polynucleobacter necessarius]|uniref:hypothetical protein n=1 Tax=Polynucleobacter necessarius TaxID=576610 RepID=UPI001E640CEE|nr:hypothetical protein [Polynucleobacter necessarius]
MKFSKKGFSNLGIVTPHLDVDARNDCDIHFVQKPDRAPISLKALEMRKFYCRDAGP